MSLNSHSIFYSQHSKNKSPVMKKKSPWSPNLEKKTLKKNRKNVTQSVNFPLDPPSNLTDTKRLYF